MMLTRPKTAQALADAAAALLADKEALALLAEKFAGNDQVLSNILEKYIISCLRTDRENSSKCI
jgi:hypothetical protein